MADDAHKDEKTDKKDAKPAAEAKPAKSLGLVPIIAALVVLIGIGVGGTMFVLKSLTPAPVEKPGEGHGEAAGGDAHGDPKAGDGHGGGTGLLKAGKELDPIGLKGNISGSGGTRYLTLDVGIWVPKADHASLNDPSVRRLIQAKLEETVKTYQLEDLSSPSIQARMKKDFTQAVERMLRTSIDSERKPEDKFVLELTVTNLLTQ
jgi:flagellar basal body-associated protein FliL